MATLQYELRREEWNSGSSPIPPTGIRGQLFVTIHNGISRSGIAREGEGKVQKEQNEGRERKRRAVGCESNYGRQLSIFLLRNQAMNQICGLSLLEFVRKRSFTVQLKLERPRYNKCNEPLRAKVNVNKSQKASIQSLNVLFLTLSKDGKDILASSIESSTTV